MSKASFSVASLKPFFVLPTTAETLNLEDGAYETPD